MNDDGPGIPNEQKQKIFEAFYQLPDDKVATAVGTGIGLAFAKSLAEAHQEICVWKIMLEVVLRLYCLFRSKSGRRKNE